MITPHAIVGNQGATLEITRELDPQIPLVDTARTEPDAASESLRNLSSALNRSASLEKDPHGLQEAAQEFEALLLAQILRMSRDAGSGGWMGSGDGKTSNPALDLAESQLAKVLALRGVLGIAKLLADSLVRNDSGANQTAAQDASDKPSTPPGFPAAPTGP